MKNIITLFTVFLLSINFSFSQKLKHELTSPWFLGLNAGATWHHTDVRNKVNVGAGFTFGRSFNRDYGNTFSYDLRLRFLGGSWIGQNTIKTDFTEYDNEVLSTDPTDYKTTYGYSINNFKTKSYELNLELSIHFNRLTERTGVDPYIFGGIGGTSFITTGNLTDDDGLLYNYNTSDNYSKSSLATFMDKSYESKLDGSTKYGNLEIMGHVGFGLGYYISPGVAIGFEHKTTFTGGDRFDGIFADKGKLKKDIYHYSGLYLKIYLNKSGRKDDETKPVKPVVPVDPVPSNPSNPRDPIPSNDCPVPVLTLQTVGNTTVNQPLFQVNGSVLNATNREVYGTLNTINSGVFTQNGNQNFTGTFQLTPGLNTIVVVSSNNCGTDTKTIQVNYVVECLTPLVSFVSPTSSNSTTTLPSVAVQAAISNLGSGTIQFNVNGKQSTSYSFNSNTGQFTAGVPLQSGNNVIQITVSNNCGSNSQTIYVQYNKPANCPAPVIDIKSPTAGSGTSNRIELSTVITNITTANQVEVFVNGVKQATGYYLARTNAFTQTLNLTNGRNTIVIRSTNNCGVDEQTIVYDVNQPCIDPTIVITDPLGSRIVSTTDYYTVRATINNVSSLQDIEFKVNGSIVTNFNYSIQSGLFSATVRLKSNENRIELSAVNQCGKASADATITYNPPCDKPVITLVNPTSNTSTTSMDFTLEAIIDGIITANDVVVLLNGVNQSVGAYNGTTHRYTKVVQLKEGNNLIQLTAKNNCGESTTSVSITYKRGVVTGNKPTVDFTNNCGITVSAGKFKFTGVVIGVTQTSQIQVKFQNSIATNVIYKTLSNGLSFELEINGDYSQSYVVEVTATNAFGSITKNCQISTEKKPVVDNDITICVLEGRVKVTKVIKESQWAEYQAKGATLGACPVVDNDITICLPQGKTNTTMVIKESQWSKYQQMGATLGACPVVDNDITICVLEGRVKVTKVIKESQWAEYQAKGATLGACPVVDNDITICVLEGRVKVTKVIKESQWADYQKMGATLGACPVVDNDITICLPQGNTNVTKVIKESQWAEYQAKGATLGACSQSTVNPDTDSTGNKIPSDKMEVCVNENGRYVTKLINKVEWPNYKRNGATEGACQSSNKSSDSKDSTGSKESIDSIPSSIKTGVKNVPPRQIPAEKKEATPIITPKKGK